LVLIHTIFLIFDVFSLRSWFLPSELTRVIRWSEDFFSEYYNYFIIKICL
jgi:hypothetical protein